MSIYIQGMKMPNDENGFVKLVIFNDGRCFVAVGENEVTSKTGIVTARELPPHGRLIDADKIEKKSYEIKSCVGRYSRVVHIVDVINAETIIPPDPEKEEK